MSAGRADVDAIYDGRYYDEELHHEHWFRNNLAKRALRWRETLQLLSPSSEDRILEIGCAAGEHTLRLAKFCHEVVGIDLSEAAITRAQARAVKEKVINVRFAQVNATDLSTLPNAYFDKVAAIDFTEHVDDETLVAALRECRRVLRPHGRLAIFTPCASHYVEVLKAHNFLIRQLPGHIAVRGPNAYRTLLPAGGFVIKTLYFSPSTYPLFGHLDRLLANIAVIGPLFRFRICIDARPIATR